MSNVSHSIIWQPEDFVLFRKCGEISVSPDAQNLGFNCGFCASTCLKADVFLHHLQDQHRENVFKMYQEKVPSHDDALIQRQELHIFNDNSFDVDWSTVDLLSMPCIALIANDKSQGSTEGTKSELITLTSSRNASDVIEDSVMVCSNNLQTKTEGESIFETNLFEYIGTPVNSSPTSYSYSSSYIGSPTSASPANSDIEIGDTEESTFGVVAQNSCPNIDGNEEEEEGEVFTGDVCSEFSDCLSPNGEDSSSKSLDISADRFNKPMQTMTEQGNQHLTNDGNQRRSEFKNCNRKYIKTAAMRKALGNKEVITCLLQLYRSNEKLWNPEHAAYKYNARSTMYNELAKPLLQKTNISLSGVEIFGILNILRGRYRRELAKFQVRKGKHRTRLWYFYEMDFLRKVIEGKRRVRLSVKNDECRMKNPNSEDLSNRQVLSFIVDQYKSNECLWNPKDPRYRTCNKFKLYNEMAVCLQRERNVLMGQNEIENEIQKLRIRYRKELRILHKLKGLYIPKLWCFDELEFLRPAMEDKIIKYIQKNSCRLQSLSKRKQCFLNVKEIEFTEVEQQLQFIDVYRKYDSLWDVDHPDYRSANYRNIALQSMLDEVNTMMEPLKVCLEQLEKTLHQMRKHFSVEKLKRLTDKDHVSVRLPGPVPSKRMCAMVYEKLSPFLATNLGPFRCEDCHEICKTYDQYKIHKSKHDGALPFICTLCGKGFQIPGNLTIHIRRHRQDFPYSCETCKKSFATSTEVTIHMRTHTGERPYICDLCGKTYKTWSFFDIHKRAHLNQSNFHCPICEKSFYERNRFTDHMNVHLNIRKHQCEHCGKGYTTVSNLKKHQELHAATKKYKCAACGKNFAQFASLRWHKKSQHEQL